MNFYLFLYSFCLVLLGLLCGCTPRQKKCAVPSLLYTRYEAKTDPNPPGHIRKSIKTMSCAELESLKEYYLVTKNTTAAVPCLEQLIKICEVPQRLQELYLELADVQFELGNMDSASKYYTLYLSLYPSSPHRAYVHYRAILCKFYLTFSADRDQTRTEETLTLTQEYLNQAKTDKSSYVAYIPDVEDVHKQCCRKLYDHDMYIVNFYYKKGSYQAASVHLEHAKKRYYALLKEVEPEILRLEYDLAQKQGNFTLAQAKQTELATKYPQMVVAASDPESKKRHAADKF